MVEYTKFVSLVWEQLDASQVEATEVTQWAADQWNENPEIATANVSEVREWLQKKL